MEMVTAMQMVAEAVNVNAQLIMSMHKIARIMDVSTSTYSKPLSFFEMLKNTISISAIFNWRFTMDLLYWNYFLGKGNVCGLRNLKCHLRVELKKW